MRYDSILFKFITFSMTSGREKNILISLVLIYKFTLLLFYLNFIFINHTINNIIFDSFIKIL